MINNFCSTLHPCAASAATAGGAGGARARAAGGAGGGARAAAAGGVFPKIKAHPTDLGGATQEHIPCSNSRQAVAKQCKHQARRRRAGQQPAQQGITIL